ncbi:MAG TPA: hypothetical protein VHE61_15165 [Opitutaceae bacterium]|nr:hypothetical protein [Opitutaceae bacterium]
MKTKLLSPVALACVLPVALAFGAPLTETTAVHTKPDSASPAVTYLKAGTEAPPASAAMANTPAGWMAVELPGPFQGYVMDRDLTKGLDVKPGTPILLQPKADAPVLAVAERGDKTSITGLHGKWTQISLQKSLVGYIRVAGSAESLPPIATTPAAAGEPAPAQPAPAPQTYGAMGPGQAVPIANQGGNLSTLPRQFTGKFVSTRSLFHPRRPYDWALNDNAGRRFAYLDMSKLLLTDQLDKYIGHFVVVFGAAKPTADHQDIVIQVESLQLLLK